LKQFYYKGMALTESQYAEIREQPEARPGKLYTQMKCRNHADSGKTFRNRWTAHMVRKLGEVGIRV